MPYRPRVVVFDVVETMMALERLRSRFVDAGLAPTLLERWFDRVLRDGMALTLADCYEPFPAVAAAALRTLARGDLDDDGVGHILAGFDELRAHPDVEPAMRMLAQAGVSIVCLSNGTADATTNFLGRAKLAGYFDKVIRVALEGHYAEVFTPADIIGDDIVDVSTQLLALPAESPQR